MEITGKLRKNDDNWEIVDDAGRARVLTAGSVCEVQVAGHWIRTTLEYCHGFKSGWEPAACGAHGEHAGHYYAMARGVLLCEGLPARVTDWRD